ncbi:ENTH domain containing protein [Histomonas meleagridis]|uniref:ENTH domain containing protein n=1 Tax=Histomonas meleagridis TaxID=135588 RepID=UPI003559F126|nr:ENTH domain containing protein [Histomonas meleagridis]KAH0796511.1 ENTH domain containing protein [Histomonas meleagridis]
MQVWKKAKEAARKTQYVFKGKDPVQKIVLEASRDDDDHVTESEFQTIAHLCYVQAALPSINKTLIKRFDRIADDVVSCQKSLQILDYCVKYGPDTMRSNAMQFISSLNVVSQSYTTAPSDHRNYRAEDDCRNLAGNLMQILKSDEMYEQIRNSSVAQIRQVKQFYVEPFEMNGIMIDTTVVPMDMSIGGINPISPNVYTPTENSRKKSTSSSDDEELDFDPRAKNKQSDRRASDPFASPQQSQSNQNTFDPFAQQQQQPQRQQQQGGFDIFNQQPQQQNQTHRSSFDQYPQQQRQQQQGGFDMFGQPQQQQRPVQQQQQGFDVFGQPQQQQRPMQQQQQGFDVFGQPQQQRPVQQQQQGFDVFGQHQQQQQRPMQQQQQQGFDVFGQPQQQQRPVQQQQQQGFDVFGQPQQQGFGQQSQNNFQQQQQRPVQQQQNFDDLLFGAPQPQPQQLPQQQYNNSFLDLHDSGSAPPPPQQKPQQSQGGGMLDEFGDLVNLDLREKPRTLHGMPQQVVRGGGQSIGGSYGNGF